MNSNDATAADKAFGILMKLIKGILENPKDEDKLIFKWNNKAL